MEDLKEYIDPKNWECLNAQKQHQLPNALFKDRDDEKKVLKSDSDAQLLIRITFGAFVKIKAIKVVCFQLDPHSMLLFTWSRLMLHCHIHTTDILDYCAHRLRPLIDQTLRKPWFA